MLTLLKGICRQVEMTLRTKSSAHSRSIKWPLVAVKKRERYFECNK